MTWGMNGMLEPIEWKVENPACLSGIRLDPLVDISLTNVRSKFSLACRAPDLFCIVYVIFKRQTELSTTVALEEHLVGVPAYNRRMLKHPIQKGRDVERCLQPHL
jgi:hypothetical protein